VSAGADVGSPPRPANPGALDAAAVRRVWDEILTMIRRKSPKAWAVVREAMVRDVHGDEIVLVFQHAVHANMFGAQVDLLVEALRDVLGGNWRVRAELGGDTTGRPQPARTDPAPAPDRSEPPPTSRSTSEGADAWPETARPGGSTPPADAPDRAANDRASNDPAPNDPAPNDPAPNDPAPARTAATPARSAPARSGSAPARPAAKATARPRAGGAPRREGDDAPADEPPFDPDYDRPPRSMYDGFDPGDEPVDEAPAARQTSEEQAMRAVTEHFVVERIGEVKPRG
jgi:DNA polymerase-3 subunit gamma/tau